MSRRIFYLVLLLLAPPLLAGEGSVFLVTPWSDPVPPCPSERACRLVIGGPSGASDLVVERMLDAPALAALAKTSAEAAAWKAFEGAAAWRHSDLVVFSIVPRPGDAAMGVQGMNARFKAELQSLASGGRDALPTEASLILSPKGPLRAPLSPLEFSEEELEAVLVGMQVRRLAVAAPRGSGTRVEQGGRLLLVGRDPIELTPEGEILIHEEGGKRVLVASDAKLEAALREGRIIEKRPVGEGITRPWRFTLEHEGQRFDAIFKDVDKRIAITSKERSFASEPYFLDSYRFERAAYLFDRMLGLGLVPPTVLRSAEGVEGALTLFVEKAVQQAKWEEEHAKERPEKRLILQMEKMRLLDALILNTDRNAFNLLVRGEDLSLHAIDHSRSFRFATTLEASVRKSPPRVPDALYLRLEALDAGEIHEQLAPLVGRQRVNALLARRVKLLKAWRAASE